MKTLIEIQQAYIDKVSASWEKWGHKTNFTVGHYRRVKGRAYGNMKKQLLAMGYSLKEVLRVAQDADDMMMLERNAA